MENSVIKVNKAKTTSITDISEWTTAFSAYMGVVISKFPHRAPELLEYVSLIHYAARYHKGLGWCVYDIKFRQKVATNKSLKWSTIDSQLWLKPFTVAPSLKEDIGVSSHDRHCQVPLGGPKTVLVTTLTGGFPVPEPLASMPINVTGLGVGKIILGSSAPLTFEQKNNLPKGWESHPLRTKAPATEKSSFGGVVTPVNVPVEWYRTIPSPPVGNL